MAIPSAPLAEHEVAIFGPRGWSLNDLLCGCYQLGWIWTFQRKTKWRSGCLFLHRMSLIATSMDYLNSFCGSGIWVLWIQAPHEPVVKVSARTPAISRPTAGEDLPPSVLTIVSKIRSSRLLAWGPQFLAVCWWEAALSFLPCGPLCRGAHIRASQEERRRGWGRWKPECFCILTLKVSSHPTLP